MKDKCSWTVLHCALQLVQIRMWLLLVHARVCVRGCGCPVGMVIDEEQRRCVIPSQCPNKSKIRTIL